MFLYSFAGQSSVCDVPLQPQEDQDLIITLATIDKLGEASGKRIAYRAINNGGSIGWVCMSMVADWDSGDGTALDVDKYLPKACGEYMQR